MKKSIFTLFLLGFFIVNCVNVYAKEDSFDLDPDDSNFQIDTEDVTVTYPDTNIFSYDGNEKIYEPSYSDVYQKLSSVKNTNGYAIDTGITMGDTKKALSRMTVGYLDEDAVSYYIGVGNYGTRFKNRIGIGCYISGQHGVPPLFGILVCNNSSSISYGFDGRAVPYSNFIGTDRVYAITFNHTSRNATFTQDYNDYTFDINSTTNVSPDLYNELMSQNIYIGGENSTIYLVKIEKTNGSNVYLFPARKIITDSDGTRKWVYGLYSDETDAIDPNAVTNGTTFSYLTGSLFDKYTILELLKDNSDSSIIYGSNDEVPVKDKSSGEIGLYNLKTSVFSKVDDVTAGEESTDIFRYEGVTRATEVGNYKCKTVLSSLGKAMKLKFSDTNEHEWSIKGTIAKPTLESNELVFDEGNILKPTLQYEKDSDPSNINSVIEGYTDVGNYSVKNTIKNKSLYAWHDFTYDDVILDWKIVPKDIGSPVISTVAYKHSGYAIKTQYNEDGQTGPVSYDDVNKHISTITYDSNGKQVGDLNEVGIYKQVMKHDKNTKWTGIDVNESDHLTYYCAVYGDYLDLQIETQNSDLKDALLTDEQKTIDNEKTAMWASSENAYTQSELSSEISELNKGTKALSYYPSAVLDIKVYKELEYKEPILCTELNAPIELSIDIPDSLKNKENIKLFRYHNGEVEEISITINNDRMTFSSDKFSIFAICTDQPPKKDKSPSHKSFTPPLTGIK